MKSQKAGLWSERVKEVREAIEAANLIDFTGEVGEMSATVSRGENGARR